MNIRENLDRILDNVALAALKAGRDPSEIEIVAATKCQSPETLQELALDGRVRVFGENRVQELLEKYRPEYTFDLIGQLQTNKVKYIIDKVRYIQSVDRDPLASQIDKLAEKHAKIQEILVEVNAGEEPQKGGVMPGDTLEFVHSLKAYRCLRVVGLMAVAPAGLAEGELEKLFMRVKALYDALQEQEQGIHVLSMGMSNDYSLAVRCGATLIRPGRALFGPRNVVV